MQFIIIGIGQLDMVRGMTIDTYGLHDTMEEADKEIDDLMSEYNNTLFFIKPTNTGSPHLADETPIDTEADVKF